MIRRSRIRERLPFGGGEARPPVVPDFAVRRDRLIALLDLAVQRQVTVVVAPPGYGKTVLVAQWAAAHPRQRVRWLTLGPEHDDGARLARDLCRALGAPPRPAARASLPPTGPGRHAGSGLLASVCADLQDAPPATIVLDDIHRLTDPAVLDELGAFVEELPRWIHAVLVTQVDPPLQDHRLRLADELVELRQDDLAFRWGEAAELVHRLAGRRLTPAQIGTLMARTEGWVAGLQLAAVSLRHRADVDGFLETFAEDDRHVAGYLTEQVLIQQPAEIREFLLSTCVLERMCGPLCDAVTGRPGGQALLDELERRSLFVTPLDPGREWFRYHQLFRALLRNHLRNQDPAGERLLSGRAATWHLERGELGPAAGYLAEAEAWDDLLDAVLTYGGAVAARGQPLAVARWIDRAPPDARHGRHEVTLLRAMVSIMAGDTHTAGRELDGLDAGREAGRGERVVADLLRARAALQHGAAAAAVAMADRALEGLATDSEAGVPRLLGLLGTRQDVAAAAHLTRGAGLLGQGDTAGAREALEAALDAGRHLWQVEALGWLALLESWSGRLTRADQVGTWALSVARELELDQQPVAAGAQLALATVARHREQLGEAGALLDEATVRATRARHQVLVTLATTERALLALALGSPADGLAVLGPLRRTAPSQEPPAVAARRRAVEARLRVLIGDVEGAQRALDLAPVGGLDVVAAALQLAIERRDLDAARRLLGRWPDEPEPRAGLERLLWLAIVDHLDGDATAARRRLAAVVAQAEIEGDLGLFRAAGHHVLGPARPLYRAEPSPFLRAVVEPAGPAVARRSGSRRELVEPLTERESVLLALLPTRLSNAEIAERLGVSVNTVKTHVKHVYRKLGVRGRSEAVAAAERMRLI